MVHVRRATVLLMIFMVISGFTSCNESAGNTEGTTPVLCENGHPVYPCSTSKTILGEVKLQD